MENVIKLKQKDNDKTTRIMYIIEAMLEYFIALGIGTDYLAFLAMEVGMSDALIGIIEAFVSLGASFRVFALLLTNKTPVKGWVTVMHVISQIFFAIIWFVPLLEISSLAKTVMIIVYMLIAYVLHNLCYPAKTNMYMSCVDDHKRGTFTALKEIVSLAGALVFTNLFGNLISYMKEEQYNLTFIVCGALLLLFMIGHTLTLVFAKEKVEALPRKKVSIKETFKKIFSDKSLLLVILVQIFYNIVHYVSIPFYATYRQSELGLSLVFIPIVAAIGSVVRMCFARPVGKIADKYSFSTMMTVCFSFLALSYLIMMFTVPSNGKVMYIIYMVIYSIATSGITSAILNITYDYVEYDNRTPALAISGAAGGIFGFISTLAVSPLVTHIQDNGNKFLGMNVYAQQVLSALALLLLIGLICYNVFVIRKLKRNGSMESAVSKDLSDNKESEQIAS